MEQGTTKLDRAPSEPLTDLIVAYHFLSSLVGFYAVFQRYSGDSEVVKSAHCQEQAERLLSEVEVIYGCWNEERRKKAAPVRTDDSLLRMERLGRRALLDRLLQGLNAWTPERHWLNLAFYFECRWERMLVVLSKHYPEQERVIAAMQKRAGFRIQWVDELRRRSREMRYMRNRVFAVPADIAS